MADIVLNSNAIIETSVMMSLIDSGAQENLSSTCSFNSVGVAALRLEVRCINCHFNNKTILIKNGPQCLRSARLSSEDKKINCGMYKGI